MDKQGKFLYSSVKHSQGVPMKKTIKKIRNKWHSDLKYQEMLGTQNKIIQDLQEVNTNLQEVNTNLHINQAWILFQRHNLDFIVKNKTWFTEYTDYADFQSDKNIKDYLYNRDSLLGKFSPPEIKAYCEVCNKFSIMKSGYNEGFDGETYFCCGMNGRMRAMYEFISRTFKKGIKVYIQEAMTSAYDAYEKYFGPDNIAGSEYLGQDKICGEYYEYDGNRIMHQDCTKLSFTDNTFDLLISQQVFEHVFDIKTALSESFRVLKDNGSCVISIPFFYNSENSVMLAKQEGENTIQLIDPPEIHGNPVSGTGSLVFWHHGWEFIRIMKYVGYSDARVRFFSNLYKGYLGLGLIITGKK